MGRGMHVDCMEEVHLKREEAKEHIRKRSINNKNRIMEYLPSSLLC